MKGTPLRPRLPLGVLLLTLAAASPARGACILETEPPLRVAADTLRDCVERLRGSPATPDETGRVYARYGEHRLAVDGQRAYRYYEDGATWAPFANLSGRLARENLPPEAILGPVASTAPAPSPEAGPAVRPEPAAPALAAAPPTDPTPKRESVEVPKAALTAPATPEPTLPPAPTPPSIMEPRAQETAPTPAVAAAPDGPRAVLSPPPLALAETLAATPPPPGSATAATPTATATPTPLPTPPPTLEPEPEPAPELRAALFDGAFSPGTTASCRVVMDGFAFARETLTADECIDALLALVNRVGLAPLQNARWQEQRILITSRAVYTSFDGRNWNERRVHSQP